MNAGVSMVPCGVVNQPRRALPFAWLWRKPNPVTGQAVLRDAPTVYRYGGKDPGYAGYHYPQLLEHGGYLYVIHAENMEDIVLLRVPLRAVEGLAG